MLEGLPIMLALCFMLWHAYYAQNYAGIIDAGLLRGESSNGFSWSIFHHNLQNLSASFIFGKQAKNLENAKKYDGKIEW